MKLNVTITGQMPGQYRQALAELRDDLGFVLTENGAPIRCRKGDGIAVRCDGSSVELTWSTDVEFYRALSLIPCPSPPATSGRRPISSPPAPCSTAPATAW